MFQFINTRDFLPGEISSFPVGLRLVGSGLYVTLSWVDTVPTSVHEGTNMSRANAAIATILCTGKSLRGHKANLVS